MTAAVFRVPETVLLDARIHPLPGTAEVVDGLAIAGGRVIAIGTASEVSALAGPGTRIVRLGGRSVLPAFIESHTHFHRGAVLSRYFLDFETLRPRTVADVLAAVRQRAATQLVGAWVQGDSLSAGRLAEKRWPIRQELDAAGGGRPVVLRGIGKHVVAASSSALLAAGIDRDTVDPDGGRIEREPDGAPTGVLHERAKLRLDQSDPATVVPSPTAAERRTALRDAQAELHRLGITTIHEMIRLPNEAADWTALHAAGDLRVRLRLFYRVHESPLSLDWLTALGIRRGIGDDRLRVLGIKVSVDGFCIVRNALVHEPYLGEPDNHGLLRVAEDRLDDLVARANQGGLQVAVHAVGVRAVDLALAAFERAGPATAGPYRLEHAYVDMDPAHFAAMRDLAVVWSTQPAFTTAYRTEWTDAFGPERRDQMMPLGVGAAMSVPLLFNSDHPCAPLDPLGGIRAAVAGEGRSAEGRVDIGTAWRAFTTAPADAAGDTHLGRLTIGSAADLIVLDEDPFAATADLGRCVVRSTLMDGTVVWDGGRLFG